MIRKKKYIGASGDYAKYELACIKALAKLLKQPYKKTLETVNLDNSLLKIISVNFDKKISIKETAKELKNALIKVAKKSPLESFVEILKKLPKKQTETIKPKFPMKLPATVTIGKVKKASRRMSGTHTDNKSHNVKINVLSGVQKTNKMLSDDIIKLFQKIHILETELNYYSQQIKIVPSFLKSGIRKEIKRVKDLIKIYKNQIQQIKKQIK